MKYTAFEELKTPRLLLRRFRAEDAQDYFTRLGSSEEVTRYMLWQPHKSLQESRESIERILGKYQSGDCYCWAIALAEDNTMIGRIDLLRLDPETGSCSFAYMLGKHFWNQGFGTEALRAVFSFAFEKMNMERITADHMCVNPASGKVMQKAGMVYTGTCKAKYEKCGTLYDADEYRITQESWNRRNSKG